MKCSTCDRRATISLRYARLSLCDEHFVKFFQKRIRDVIHDYHMDGKFLVGLSGGKDSAALLHALLECEIEAVPFHINLGIGGYSERCEKVCERLASKLGVKLLVYRMVEEDGITLEDFRHTSYGRKICSVCGTLKRYILNRAGVEMGATVATAHNLDDVANFILSCLVSGDFDQLARLKPVLPSDHPKLAKKVKPLFRTPASECLAYARILDLPFMEEKCPHSVEKGIASGMSVESKYQLLSTYEKKLIPLLGEKKVELKECKRCGFPTTEDVCARCKRISMAKRVKKG